MSGKFICIGIVTISLSLPPLYAVIEACLTFSSEAFCAHFIRFMELPLPDK